MQSSNEEKYKVNRETERWHDLGGARAVDSDGENFSNGIVGHIGRITDCSSVRHLKLNVVEVWNVRTRNSPTFFVFI